MRISATENIGDVNVGRVTGWLDSVLVPTLVEPQYFEAMGFAPAFVRRFLRKHGKVLRFDGRVDRKVRGINELEFLRGVADVLGVRSLAEPWDPRDIATITAVAHRCAAIVASMDRTPKAAEPATHKADSVPGASELVVEATS